MTMCKEWEDACQSGTGINGSDSLIFYTNGRPSFGYDLSVPQFCPWCGEPAHPHYDEDTAADEVEDRRLHPAVLPFPVERWAGTTETLDGRVFPFVRGTISVESIDLVAQLGTCITVKPSDEAHDLRAARFRQRDHDDASPRLSLEKQEDPMRSIVATAIRNVRNAILRRMQKGTDR